jgi:hypothetical protein
MTKNKIGKFKHEIGEITLNKVILYVYWYCIKDYIDYWKQDRHYV